MSEELKPGDRIHHEVRGDGFILLPGIPPSGVKYPVLQTEGIAYVQWDNPPYVVGWVALNLLTKIEKEKPETLGAKLDERYEELLNVGNRMLPADVLKIFREHFDSKREAIDQALSDWMSDADAEDNWSERLRSILFGDEL